MATSLLDETLFNRFTEQGDVGALEELIKRWQVPAYQIARCVCGNGAWAEEAVQEAHLKLLSRQTRFASRGPGSFRAWFLSLVTNCARMALRRERRAEARKNIDPLEYASRKGLCTLEQEPNAEGQRHDRLRRAVNGLAEPWRTPVRLHFLNGMRQKDLACRLEVSQQMVSRRIGRGLNLLRLGLNRQACQESWLVTSR